METNIHVLWGCASLSPVREGCSFMGNLPHVIRNSLLDFLIFCRSILSCSNMQLLGVILWRVWHHRNCLKHQNSNLHVDEIVPWCKSYLHDFVAAHELRRPVSVNRFLRWILPISGDLKLNTDASLDPLRCKIGLGVVLRNHYREVLLSGLVSFNGSLQPDVAEAKTILFGVFIALEGGFLPFSIEFDTVTVINCLNGSKLPFLKLVLYWLIF
ncbi:hypothetical protein ACOSQ3_002103 [Xanthoceras sorbifolium]